jgi:hypothetical protein
MWHLLLPFVPARPVRAGRPQDRARRVDSQRMLQFALMTAACAGHGKPGAA